MTKKQDKKVSSLQDLADLAGVSRATASRALNDSPMLNAKTKARIQALARKHRYSVNRRARDFRLSRTSVVAVVFMLDIESGQHMSDPFFLGMLGGIADCLSDRDYDLLLARAPVADIRELRESRTIRRSDGVIFIGQGEQHAQLDELARGDIPVVAWGYPVPGKHYPVVGGDNASGGHQAAAHLLQGGRRKIAFFGHTGNPENAARYDGFATALREAGIDADPQLKFDVPFEMERAHDVIVEIIGSGPDFDSVVCASDVIALAALSTFHECGIRVPRDVAVVGYDNISLAEYSSPPLTTISQHIPEAGRILVESVLRRIDGEAVEDTILPSELVVRKSSGSKPGATRRERRRKAAPDDRGE